MMKAVHDELAAGLLPLLDAEAAHVKKGSPIQIVSAFQLTDSQRQALKARLGAFTAADESVDPSLVAGFVVRADGRLLDGSLKNRFQRYFQS
jgi:F0F1-type ATP synthase delta subunit